jgi:GTP-binding protein
MARPLVAIVGRPNVGKSTLFNRLIGERRAVVDDVAGTTRDRLVAEAEWNGLAFDVVDTGGIEPLPRPARGAPLAVDSARFIPEIRAQAEMAIAEADAVVFMVDAAAGPTTADREVAEILRRRQVRRDGRLHPPVLLAANKADNLARSAEAASLYELGMGDPYPISALHGTGTGDLLDALVEALRAGRAVEPQPAEADDTSVKIAIVGRPNVGKSSLLNRLLGEERAIVSPVPGTTRDAVDTPMLYQGTPITLIDTAGLRRRGHIDPGVEKWSVLRTFRAITRADVALLLIDASEPFTNQDAHVAGFILDAYKSAVVVVNKWDAVEKDEHTLVEYTRRLRSELNFLDYVPVLFISAKTGQRVDQVLPTALRVQAERQRQVPTPEINRLVREAVAAHPPHPRGNRLLKISHVAQVAAEPPTFLFHVNDPELLHFTYRRYLENRLRAEYSFLGTPLRLSFRKKGRES